MKTKYQIRYRLKSAMNTREDHYTVPYFELPAMELTLDDAYATLRRMESDFPSAEWALIEVRP